MYDPLCQCAYCWKKQEENGIYGLGGQSQHQWNLWLEWLQSEDAPAKKSKAASSSTSSPPGKGRLPSWDAPAQQSAESSRLPVVDARTQERLRVVDAPGREERLSGHGDAPTRHRRKWGSHTPVDRPEAHPDPVHEKPDRRGDDDPGPDSLGRVVPWYYNQYWQERLSARDAPAVATNAVSFSRNERYAVRRPLFNDILSKLVRGDVPSVDAFADAELHLLEHWWGPGSSIPDALAIDWSQERLMWCNPPFSTMSRVVRKIREDRARAILICPHWTNQSWFAEVQPMVVNYYYYKKDSVVFETKNGACADTKWATWALLLDGSYEGPVCGLESLGHYETSFPRTTSSGRRWRRKQTGSYY